MEAKDSPSAPDLEVYFLLTVMEDGAESAMPPLPAPAVDDEGDR